MTFKTTFNKPDIIESYFSNLGLRKGSPGKNNADADIPRPGKRYSPAYSASAETFQRPDIHEIRRHPGLVPGQNAHTTTLNKPDINEDRWGKRGSIPVSLGIRQLAGFE